MPTLPGHIGISIGRASSYDERVLGKFTDANHLDSLRSAEPAMYDKKMFSLFTNSEYYSNDFLNMIYKAEPYYIRSNSDSWQWDVSLPYKFNQIVAIPDSTAANINNLGKDESTFTLVFERASFQINDIITADKRWGDALIIKSDPKPYGVNALYEVALTGENVTNTTVAQSRFIRVGQSYEQVDNITGEFTQTLSGLDNFGDKLTLVESLSAGWGVQHHITKWADQRTLRDSMGRPLDLIAYTQYKMGENGKKETLGVRWEPFIESEIRKKMLRLKTQRMIWGFGGQSTEKTGKQEVRKHTQGIYHKAKNHGHHITFNRGGFTINLLRDVFGDLFYRRVDVKNRMVKLFTNEAGISLFRNANKEDLLASGLTLVADGRFIEGSGQNMMVNYGFDMMYSMETGKVQVSHLRELDEPQSQLDFNLNKKSAPIFFVFDITNPDGGLQNNIREVRLEGNPSQTWGYVDGRMHHLGFAASQGMSSSSMDPGYKIWYEDRADLFVEDLSKTLIIEEQPSY